MKYYHFVEFHHSTGTSDTATVSHIDVDVHLLWECFRNSGYCIRS